VRTIIDIRKIRYLNLFERITKIRGRDCFFYNNMVFFAVNSDDIFKAIGKNSENLKKLSGIIGKRIRIITYPSKIKDASKFILQIITPLELREITINDKEVVIDAGSREAKALLIGRDKKKLEELENIIKSFFGCDIKVI
jgi:N utilization substance protein A